MGATIGLTPKSSFLDWLLSNTMDSGSVDVVQQRRRLREVRAQLFHRFWNKMAAAHAGRHCNSDDASDARLTHSTAALSDDNWVVDTDAAECHVTDAARTYASPATGCC